MSLNNEATSSSQAQKQTQASPTVAKQIGLTVPIKEKAVKGFVKSLADGEKSNTSVKNIPRQVQKKSVVAVAAAVEKVLTEIVAECVKTVEGSTFTVDNVTKPLRANDQFGFVATFLEKGLEYVATHKKTKKDDAAENLPEDEDSHTPYTFSCSKIIKESIQAAVDSSQLRVASEAVQLVQYLLDEFYQKVVQGAYWITQRHGMTVSKDDIFVAIKISLPTSLSDKIMKHVHELTQKFEEIEDGKKETKTSTKGSGEKSIKTTKKATTTETASKPAPAKSESAQPSAKKAEKTKKVAKERAAGAVAVSH